MATLVGFVGVEIDVQTGGRFLLREVLLFSPRHQAVNQGRAGRRCLAGRLPDAGAGRWCRGSGMGRSGAFIPARLGLVMARFADQNFHALLVDGLPPWRSEDLTLAVVEPAAGRFRHGKGDLRKGFLLAWIVLASGPVPKVVVLDEHGALRREVETPAHVHRERFDGVGDVRSPGVLVVGEDGMYVSSPLSVAGKKRRRRQRLALPPKPVKEKSSSRRSMGDKADGAFVLLFRTIAKPKTSLPSESHSSVRHRAFRCSRLFSGSALVRKTTLMRSSARRSRKSCAAAGVVRSRTCFQRRKSPRCPRNLAGWFQRPGKARR